LVALSFFFLFHSIHSRGTKFPALENPISTGILLAISNVCWAVRSRHS